MFALVFVTHTPMRNKIIMAVSFKIFLKHQQQRCEELSKSFRCDNYFVLVAMVAEYRSCSKWPKRTGYLVTCVVVASFTFQLEGFHVYVYTHVCALRIFERIVVDRTSLQWNQRNFGK